MNKHFLHSPSPYRKRIKIIIDKIHHRLTNHAPRAIMHSVFLVPNRFIQISSVKFERKVGDDGTVDRSPVEKTIQPMETN